MAEKQMTRQKLSHQKGTDLSRLHPWNPQWEIHKKTEIKIKKATGTLNTFIFNPNDVRIHY